MLFIVIGWYAKYVMLTHDLNGSHGLSHPMALISLASVVLQIFRDVGNVWYSGGPRQAKTGSNAGEALFRLLLTMETLQQL